MSRRVALIVSVLFWLAAAGLYLASMLTNFWITDIVENFGLFRVCVSSECFDIGKCIVVEFFFASCLVCLWCLSSFSNTFKFISC